MKTILFLALFISASEIFSQEDAVYAYELSVKNESSGTIYFQMFPISMILNGIRDNVIVGNYDLKALHPYDEPDPPNSGWWYSYNNGVGIYKSTNGTNTPYPYYTLENGQSVFFNQDAGDEGPNHASYGYGVYKIVFSGNTNFYDYLDSILIDFDWRGFHGDNHIRYTNNGIYFDLQGYGSILINYNNEDDYFIKPWKRWGLSRGNGNGKYDNTYGNNYNIMPLDSRRDCSSSPVNHNHEYPYWTWHWGFGDYVENRQGVIALNLTIQKDDVTTPTANQLIIGTNHFTNQIVINNDIYLKLDDNREFTMVEYPDIIHNTTMTVKGRLNANGPTPALLWLSDNSTFRIKRNSKLVLEKNSQVKLHPGSKIIREPGGIFCNGGANIFGNGLGIGEIILQGRQKLTACLNVNEDWLIQDSIRLILSDSGSIELPDSSTITLDGSAASLIMNPNSEIRFGRNSKLILKNGARISANNCKFTSLDSSGTWDGIYIEDNAYDTIINCTIENAYNGINIEKNDVSIFNPYTTEISGCTFNNTTDTQLVSCIYVNDCDGILIRDCIVESDISNGYSAGIITEYCSTNGVVIIDNEINNSTTGIAVIQSSPYIARNIITGLSETGTGISLDNSNGTIEYNIVNNFQKSISASYSSPYLLKNTFSDASDKNMDLTSNSMPVMKPVASGSALRWLGGNNTITGTPSNSGISFVDCYPLMDSGYNRIIVNGSDYMNGVFTLQTTTVNARLNYWYDSPPQSSLFDISSGMVYYDNYFDGTSVPYTAEYELNSLGFGLYDTVYSNQLGDTPTPEDLFSQAYVKEMQTDYEDAIDLYKEVVSSFKSSSYAPVSLSRIFNCLEKDESSVSDYQAIQSYYNSIKNDTNNLFESRGLSEDFVIKSKVKQGHLEDAITDYDNIYQLNTNNSKGQHALINKICLMNMYQGGDNQGSGNSNTNHKTNLLTLLQGREIRNNHLITSNVTPIAFKLHQNYPNPFNPQTTIKYDIPKDNFVTIKIYDLLGREIFNSGEFKKAGSYEVKFDGSNFASGMYFYVLESGNFKEVEKMVLIK